MAPVFVEGVCVFLEIFRAACSWPDWPCVWPGDQYPLPCRTLPIQPYSSGCSQNIQPNQRSLGFGEVSDDFLYWRRQPAHQGWNGDDLVALCQLRVLEQVDDFDTVLALQLVLTNLP